MSLCVKERIRVFVWVRPLLVSVPPWSVPLGACVPVPSCLLALGAVLAGFLCLRCLEFAVSLSSLSSFVSSLPVVGAVSSVVRPVAPPVSAPAPAVCPLLSDAGVPFSVVVAGRSVPSSAFVPVALGVVSAVSAADPRGVVCVVGGRSFRCLWSALGGRSSPAAVGLVAALRAARASGVSVDLWCAPGRGGLPCPGYFCAVSAR